MANYSFITKNLFKMWKSSVKHIANLRAKLAQNFVQIAHQVINSCKTATFPHLFSYFPTLVFTTIPPQLINCFFHYSTDPTITTTNNLIIRRPHED